MLMAIETNAHLRASRVLAAEVNESSNIIAMISQKGFRILEVKFAIRFLISVCLSMKPPPSPPALDLPYILAYFRHFANPPLLPSPAKKTAIYKLACFQLHKIAYAGSLGNVASHGCFFNGCHQCCLVWLWLCQVIPRYSGCGKI